MAMLTGLIRRTLWLVLLGLVGTAAAQWWRDRQAPDAPAAPEWPPIDVTPATADASTPPADDSSAHAEAESPTPEPASDADDSNADREADSPTPAAATDGSDDDSGPTRAAESSAHGNDGEGDDSGAGSAAGSSTDEVPVGTASFVNALVDAPEARSASGADGSWVEPDEDGGCPISHPIKANDNSGIFHVPGGRFYDRTKAERCYADADGAAADGYRQAKS